MGLMGIAGDQLDRLEPCRPAAVVAKGALKSRLRSVLKLAPLAAKAADKDVEHVHQLRVSVRRAGAALSLFSPMLPRSRTRKVRRGLKSLRQAAGPARDLDVLAQRIACFESDLSPIDFACLLDLVVEKRRLAQRELKLGYRKSKKGGLKKRSLCLLEKMHWRGDKPEPSFGEYARETFQPVLNQFFSAANKDLGETGNLHQLRIKGKRVRYAMELLAPAFDERLHSEIYPLFKQFQDRLGALNDHVTAIGIYRQLLESGEKNVCVEAIQSMIRIEETDLLSSSSRFIEWWTSDRREDLKVRLQAALQ